MSRLGGSGLFWTNLDTLRAWIEVCLVNRRRGASRAGARHYAAFAAAVRWRA